MEKHSDGPSAAHKPECPSPKAIEETERIKWGNEPSLSKLTGQIHYCPVKKSDQWSKDANSILQASTCTLRKSGSQIQTTWEMHRPQRQKLRNGA